MKFIVLFITAVYSGNIFSQPDSFYPRGIGGGGSMYAMSINSADDNEYYAACDMGEIFHTTDFGLSYNQVHYNQLIASPLSKVCFTSTPGLLYSIGQPNGYFAVPVISTDNGITWNTLTGNPALTDYENSERTWSINADFNNPDRVLISYHNVVYYSTDRGTTFRNIHNASNSTSGIVVSGVLFDDNNIYIGTNDGVLVSTNAGANWSVAAISGIPANERIWSFTAARVGTTTRFFCITANEEDISVDLTINLYDDWNFARGVYSVDYGIGNWVLKTTGINMSAFAIIHVDMAQNDINTAYISAADGYDPLIFKTENAGTNWTNVLVTPGNQNVITGWCGQNGNKGWGASGRPFGIDVAPNNANKVIFGGWGFVHKTANGGNLWQQAYVNVADQHPINAPTPKNTAYHSIGFENTSCWQVHWVNANTMWACFTDMMGIRSTDAGASWSFAQSTGSASNDGETYRVVQHPVNETLFSARAGIHDIYQETYLEDAKLDITDTEGKIIYSTDNGLNWQVLKLFNHPVFWIALDPNNPDRAYASVVHYNGGTGAGGIYMTEDLQNLTAATWTLLPDPPRTEKHPASIVVLNDGKMVCSYSARIIPDYETWNHSYTASSGVFMYDPANNSWEDVTDPRMNYYTKDLIIDPFDATQNTWYAAVCSGGWSPNPAADMGGLYKTANRGASWIKIIDAVNIESCTFNPDHADELYVTTATQGLWVSHNISSTTPTFSVINSYNFWHPTRVFFNPFNKTEMWVASFGNGMKVGNMGSQSAIENTIGNAKFTLYPIPSEDNILIQFYDHTFMSQKAEIYDNMGKRIKTLIVQNNTIINISDLARGIYFILLPYHPEQSQKFIKL